VDENLQIAPSPEAPRGFHQGRVDDKGRLKLPATLHQFLAGSGYKTLFVTTLDELTGRLYPIPSWRETEKILGAAGEDQEAADSLMFLANHYGSDSDVDGQGRMLVPKELRQRLEVEDRPVWLIWNKNRIDLYGEAMYKEKLRDSQANSVAAMARLKMRGV
jgi:DNA-binding transcriptional regulator/RsmH inhibitor MraZ